MVHENTKLSISLFRGNKEVSQVAVWNPEKKTGGDNVGRKSYLVEVEGVGGGWGSLVI